MSIDKDSAGKKGKMRLSSDNSRNTAHIAASASEAQLTSRKAAVARSQMDITSQKSNISYPP